LNGAFIKAYFTYQKLFQHAQSLGNNPWANA
jgi:hypothetical protein